MWKQSDLGLGPTPYTGQTPQAESDAQQLQRDYSMTPLETADTMSWAMTPRDVLVKANVEPQALLDKLDAHDLYPHAYGIVEVHYNWSSMWYLQYTNISLHLVEKQLRAYAKEQDWLWDGFVGPDGYMTGTKHSSVPGIGEINPGLKDWRHKEWAGMDSFDSPAPFWNEKPFYGEQDYPDDDPIIGDTYTCSECGAVSANSGDWHKHIMEYHVHADGPDRSQSVEPVVDLDQALPAHWNEAIRDKMLEGKSAGYVSLNYRWAAQPGQIPGPIPYIYDIEQDRIYVGHPGERHSDIQGRFTPGGVIEGVYDPKGAVQIRTDTDMPYTVRHMVELWYHMHPELEVKSVYLLSGEKKYRLASSNIGHKVRNLAYCSMSGEVPTGYALSGPVQDVINHRVPESWPILHADRDTLENTLAREIYSWNAMAVDLETGQLIDPFDGSLDAKLDQKIYRMTKQRVSNILDPIQDQLDPDVFEEAGAQIPVLKQKHIDWVKDKVYTTMVDAGWPDPKKYLSLVLTGSLTTYQWSDRSDFDVSLWVDTKNFPEWVRADLISLMITKCDGNMVPGTTHPIQCFVVNTNLYQHFSDLYQPGLRSGYWLDKHKWVVLPEKGRSLDVYQSYPEIVNFAHMVADKMKMMLKYNTIAVAPYWHFIHQRRFRDMQAGKGDYSEWNIVYKLLANEDLFPLIEKATGEHIA